MSTTATTSEHYHEPTRSLVTRFTAAMQRCWAAYVAWRMEEESLAVLRSMSDRELQDIGLARSEIASAARHGRTLGRPAACE